MNATLQESLIWFFGDDSIIGESDRLLKGYTEGNNLDMDDIFSYNNITRLSIAFFDRHER